MRFRRFAAAAGFGLLWGAAVASGPPPSPDPSSAATPAAPPTNAPQGGDSTGDLYQMAKNLFDENAPPEIRAEYEFPERAQFLDFAARLQAAMDGGSLGDLAAFAPEARAVLAALRLSPEAADYADWLEARLQEIETAALIEEKAGTLPSPQLPTGPSLAPVAPPRALAPVTPRPAPTIPFFNVWLRRLRDRPPPANAGRLMPRLRADFAAEGVSPDLAWLAEAESSLNPRASNPSGARGLFQLKAATAKDLGLSTFLPDQRTDPDKSARAAARYLRSLELRFGSWPLALAAYNAGEGRVARALTARRASNFAEIASDLPAGTRMYVPEVCALIETRTGTPPAGLPLPRG